MSTRRPTISVYGWAKLDLPKIPHDKTHIGHAVPSRPLLGECHLGGITIHANDTASRRYKTGRGECDVTRSGADIKDAHARCDAGPLE